MELYTHDAERPRSVYTLKEMPVDELPREKLMNLGPEYLTDAELIAILFRSGTRNMNAVDLARSVLQEHGSLQKFKSKKWQDFKNIPGVGLVRALTLEAALELGRRVQRPVVEDKRKFNKPDMVYRELAPFLAHLPVEHFIAFLMNKDLNLISWRRLSTGTRTFTLVDPVELYRIAVLERASNVILVHNHPGGTLAASQADIMLTEKLQNGLNKLSIGLSDHIIICGDRYVSMRKAGLIPETDCD